MKHDEELNAILDIVNDTYKENSISDEDYETSLFFLNSDLWSDEQ